MTNRKILVTNPVLVHDIFYLNENLNKYMQIVHAYKPYITFEFLGDV